MNVSEIRNIECAVYVGATIEIDKVKIYEGSGVALYRSGMLISFIEMNVIDVVEMKEGFTEHQYYIKPDIMSQGIYLYKESPKIAIRKNERVVKKGDDSRCLVYLFSHSEELKEKFTDIEIASLKDQLFWTIIEVHDSPIAKIERGGITEMVLIKDLLSEKEIKQMINSFENSI